EKEVEGRYEEVWLVVEEDPLDQWPEGPREVVGRPATRVDAPEKASGQARYTADLKLPGMLHATILRSPHARARAKTIEVERARTAPGVRAILLPDDAQYADLSRDANYHGAPV